MVKGLDSYEEKEDEVIKEVSGRRGRWEGGRCPPRTCVSSPSLQMAARIREVEHSRQELVRSVLEVGAPRRSRSSIHPNAPIPGSPRPPGPVGPSVTGSAAIPSPVRQGAGRVRGDVGGAGREEALAARAVPRAGPVCFPLEEGGTA